MELLFSPRALTRSGYRRELMHLNSTRAGFVDLEGCTPVELLPRHRPHFLLLSPSDRLVQSIRPDLRRLLDLLSSSWRRVGAGRHVDGRLQAMPRSDE